MAYGLKIELVGTSPLLSKRWKVRISKKDYVGTVSYCNVPAASPFIWKKDAAQTIRGTSFDFSINATTDFQFIDLYTCDNKEYKVELLNQSDVAVWVGYILTEQYQETYKPAPNVISFSASDQLGLLKDAVYTSTATRKSLLAIINECLANTELNLPYSIGISIQEVRQTANRSVLGEIYEDASVFDKMKCYDVIDSILGQYSATITQDGCRWLITDSLKIDARINYSNTIAFESVGSAPSTVVLGELHKSGTQLYPIGSPLDMSLATAYSTLEITDDYGVRADILPNSNKENWTNDTTLPGWTPFGESLVNGPVTIHRKESLNKEYFFTAEGYTDSSNPLDNGVRVDLANVEATTEEISLIFDIGVYNADTVYVRIRLTNGTTTYNLKTSGWVLDDETIQLYMIPQSTPSIPVFSKFSISATGFPIAGDLSIEITLPVVTPLPGDEQYAVTMLRGVSLIQLASSLAQSAGQIRTVKLNKSTSAQSKSLKIYAGDVSFVANAKHIFKNYASLADNTPTGQWITEEITSTTLLNVIQKLYASDNRAAKQILKGRIRGASIAFDTLVQINYPYARKFEFTEFSYDLIGDAVDVTLSEIFDYEEVAHTITTEGLETSGSSSSSSSGSSGSADVMAVIETIKGVTNGIASLDASGLVPSTQLPSYVDDVLEYANRATFPTTGETAKIYIATDTGLTWRWSGSTYVQITSTDHTHSDLTALETITATLISQWSAAYGWGNHASAGYLTAITKAMVEAVLTGNITSHTHSAYLTAITKAMIEAQLTGSITSHTHAFDKNIKAEPTEIVTGITKDLLLTFKNTSDVKKWFVCLGSSDQIELYNAAGTKALTLTQGGILTLLDDSGVE